MSSKKKAPKPKKQPGRPSVHTEKLAAKICARLAAGETLRSVCRDEGMPSEVTVRRWALGDHAGFSAQYARAREIGYHGMADELVEIADEVTFDTIRGTGDEPDKANHEWITRSRLRVDTRKWLLSKALPKIYGDKSTMDVNATIDDMTTDPRELARLVAFLLTAGVQQPEETPPLH